jgi:hypothetical protein
LKKALAERALNAEIDHYLANGEAGNSHGGAQTGRWREGESMKKKTKPMERSTREPLPLRLVPRST